MKKKTMVTMVAVLIAIGCASSNGIASDMVLTNEEEPVDVQFRQVIDASEEVTHDQDVFASVEEAASSTGWIYNSAEKRFERLVTYDSVEVTISELSEDMSSNLAVESLNDYNDIVMIKVYDTVTDETYTRLVESEELGNTIIFGLDISAMLTVDYDNEWLEKEESGLLPTASYTNPYWSNGEKGFYGYRLHCNRFNGYLGDGRYYSSHTSAQTLLNFFGSDCDWALGSYSYCLADYGDNPYCAASPASKQARCSTLIGHYNRFHKHTTYSN